VDDVIINDAMAEIIFIAGTEDGPLEKACQRVFGWDQHQNLIVIVWHAEWRNKKDFWDRIAKTMAAQTSRASTLVVFFGDSIEAIRSGDGGDRLPLLLRLLGRDPQSRHGCCPITDFPHLGGAPIAFDRTDPETALILKGNIIMGLSQPLQSSS